MGMSFSFESQAFISPIRREQKSPAHFPIERELRFRLAGKRDEMAGSGKTIDIGSKRILFRTEKTPVSGKRVEIAISWPAQLDQKCALKLVAQGRIEHAESGVVAVSIEHYEFRTVGMNGLSI